MSCQRNVKADYQSLARQIASQHLENIMEEERAHSVTESETMESLKEKLKAKQRVIQSKNRTIKTNEQMINLLDAEAIQCKTSLRDRERELGELKSAFEQYQRQAEQLRLENDQLRQGNNFSQRVDDHVLQNILGQLQYRNEQLRQENVLLQQGSHVANNSQIQSILGQLRYQNEQLQQENELLQAENRRLQIQQQSALPRVHTQACEQSSTILRLQEKNQILEGQVEESKDFTRLAEAYICELQEINEMLYEFGLLWSTKDK